MLVVTALLGACADLASAQTPAQQDNAESINRGRQIAETNCARCHAIGLAGQSHHPMAPPFRTLSRRYPVEDIAEAFAEGVRVGHPDMPEFQFEPRQIDDLVNYLQSVQELHNTR